MMYDVQIIRGRNRLIFSFHFLVKFSRKDAIFEQTWGFKAHVLFVCLRVCRVHLTLIYTFRAFWRKSSFHSSLVKCIRTTINKKEGNTLIC